MNTPGVITTTDNGYECTACGKEILVGRDCIKADYTTVIERENGTPTTATQNYAGIWHIECFKNESPEQ